MGAPNITGDFTGGVTEDSGDIITGQLQDNGNTAGNTWSISSASTFGTASINAAGEWSYDLDDTNSTVNDLHLGDTLTDTFVVQVTDVWGTDTQTITITITGVPCFTAGTRIETEFGIRRIEDLRAGDRVWTADNGLRQVKWIGRRIVSSEEMFANDSLRPVLISKGALGNGLPTRPLKVSRQHRMLVSSAFEDDVLIAAIRLCKLKGVNLVETCEPVEYIHLLFDEHEIVMVEGTPSESLLLTPSSLSMMSEAARQEIAEFFPCITDGRMPFSAARDIPEQPLQKKIVNKFSRLTQHR